MFIYIHRPCGLNGSVFWPFTVWGFPKPIFKPHEYWLCKACCCNSTYRLRYWNSPERMLISARHAKCCNSTYRLRYWNTPYVAYKDNFNFLACCNSTYRLRYWNLTHWLSFSYFFSSLQQYLPFTVLKLTTVNSHRHVQSLQQYLPFTVLKHADSALTIRAASRCNSTYRLRYWNRVPTISRTREDLLSCNSTYRLRYATKGARQQRSEETMRTAHL